MDNLNRDFLEFIGYLNEERVEYLVIGGYAVGFHGFPRYTGDIDFIVAVSDGNSETGIDGVIFEECRKGEVKIEINGLTVKFMGKDDLMRNKSASGRAKDLIDLDELRKL